MFASLLEELEAICPLAGDGSPGPSSGETKPEFQVAA
jgi:hypothetical protein